MSPTAPSPALRTPCQARSRRTLERILDVTEELLAERPFEAIPVGEIVRRAGTSVGAFYSRFRDKDALLPALYARYDRWVGEHAARLRAERPWEGRSLAEIARWFVRELLRLFGERRYLMRAMAILARTSPEKIDAETRARRKRELAFLRDALLTRREEMNHPTPERAADLATYFAATTIREVVLFDSAPHTESTGLSESELEDELVRQLLGYLGASPAAPDDPDDDAGDRLPKD